MQDIGKIIMLIGIVLIAIGFFFALGSKIGLGKLPGDVIIKKDNFTFYFPIATILLISSGVSLLLYVVKRLL